MRSNGSLSSSPRVGLATRVPSGAGWPLVVAEAASEDVGGIPVAFLDDYLPLLQASARQGRVPRRDQSDAVPQQGRRAAERGVPVVRGVDQYLSAARRVWEELPAPVREPQRAAVRPATQAVLQVVERAVAAFAEGHAEAGREMVRREETQRRELVEDLLRGDANLGDLVGRAEPFGLDLTRDHQVALARPGERLPSITAAITTLERVVLDRLGDRDVLVAIKGGLVVVIVPVTVTGAPLRSDGWGRADDLGKVCYGELSRLKRGPPWQVVVGRAHPSAYRIARSYEEALEGITIVARMKLDRPIVETNELLTYRLLARDQPALVDLVESVLTPPHQARGGARPLLDTLAAYFACGWVATLTATRMHLSVRAVTYRFERVMALTSFDPLDPVHRFTLEAAVLGARLLGRPDQQPPPRPTESSRATRFRNNSGWEQSHV